MTLKHISVERLQEIEQEREKTQSDPEFHSWMQQLNIGRLCIKHDGIIRAKIMMQDWTNQQPKKETTWEWMFMVLLPKQWASSLRDQIIGMN